MKLSLLMVLLIALTGPAAGTTGISEPGVLDSRAPVIEVQYPAGGEIFRTATPETIRFTIDEQSWDAPPGLITLHFLVEGSPPAQTDITPEPDGTYAYVWQVPGLPGYNDIEARIRVTATDGFGWNAAAYSDWFMVFDDVSPVPASVLADRLGPVHPNPFNPQTTIAFSLAAPADVELAIFDVRGRRVVSLLRAALGPGAHECAWDGRTADGGRASSGSYFALLSLKGQDKHETMVARLTLVK